MFVIHIATLTFYRVYCPFGIFSINNGLIDMWNKKINDTIYVDAATSFRYIMSVSYVIVYYSSYLGSILLLYYSICSAKQITIDLILSISVLTLTLSIKLVLYLIHYSACIIITL